ncbi:MAG: AI-2E family transporter [Microbacterium sp.]|uniref:AI-2E family transporter n=1 Tax=Microbacterium sp. TaxID=51671 RepID=UPI0039E2DEB3
MSDAEHTAAPADSAQPVDAVAPPAAPDPAAVAGRAPRASWARLSNPFAVGFSLTLGGLVAILLGMAISNLSTVIIYVVFALFAALGLDPLVRLLERRNISRPWGIVTVYGGFAVLLVGVLWLIIPTVVSQIAQFIRDVPDMVSDFQSSDVFAWLQSHFGDIASTLLDQVQTFLSDPSNIAAIGGGVVQVGVTIGTTISGLIIILVLSLYFLASLPTMKHAFTRLAPARNRPTVSSLTDQITNSIGGYLGGMVVLASCNAVLTLILYLVMGLPFPVLMAVTAFCITLIPLVGSVLFWAVGSLVALFSSPVAALVFAIAYLVYMQLEAYVLTPKVMNRTISVPGSLVVIGALVGGTLLGLLGALVAIPVTASILLIIKQVVIPKQDAKV